MLQHNSILICLVLLTSKSVDKLYK